MRLHERRAIAALGLSVTLGKYVKAAFKQHWNLLAFLGGVCFSALSGHPDVFLPIVAAGELAYLALLGTHPKFQAYVNAQEAKAARELGTRTAEAELQRMVQSLPKAALERFQALRGRCLQLRQIAVELKHPGFDSSGAPLESFQTQGLDRLLWIYLRLLFTQTALARFLESTDENLRRKEIASLEGQIVRMKKDPSTPQREKAIRTLEDSLQTCRDRLDNLQKARENYELMGLEIARLENKIQALSELALNRQEPDFVSGQIDQVAKSMVETEQTMNDLRFATGLDMVDQEVPSLLERPTVKTRQ